MKKTEPAKGNDLLRALTEGQPGVLDNLYELHREDFLRWAGRRFSARGHEDFLDAWQDSMIAFYEQVISRKLTDLRCDVRTYLFAIGYRSLLKNNRKMKRFIWKDEIDDAIQKDREILAFEWDEPLAEERKVLSATITQLSPQCQEMLVQRYYHEKTIEEIQQELSYQSANSVSASMSRCVKRLKELIEEKWKK